MRLNETVRWVVLCLSIVPFLGVPLLLLMWFPCLKHKLYYQDCQIQEATHLWVHNADDVEEPVDLQYGQLVIGLDRYQTTFHFTNRLLKYYRKEDGQFEALQYNSLPQLTQFMSSGIRGLSHVQAQQHFATYGEGLMQFQRKNCWQLTYFEVTRPMFLFVIFCVLQYAFTDYLQFGLCILAFTILALLFTVREKLLSQDEMEGMLTKERQYSVLRNQRIIETSSRGVVPGDIVFFRDGNVPFDGVLVQGAALIDEASLTG